LRRQSITTKRNYLGIDNPETEYMGTIRVRRAVEGVGKSTVRRLASQQRRKRLPIHKPVALEVIHRRHMIAVNPIACIYHGLPARNPVAAGMLKPLIMTRVLD
jgi:hypothetical protein